MFRNFLETIQYPDKTEADEPDEEARNNFNRKQRLDIIQNESKIYRERKREEMQTFIRPSAPGSKLKADFDKLNRDIVTNLNL